jgi:hypothetical protein
MSEYIFGQIDVPALASDKSKVAAFDMSRSMQLNRSNTLVMVLFGFLGNQVEIVRRSLVEEERRKRQTAEAKKLAREAEQISKLINEDFSTHMSRLKALQSKSRGKRDLLSQLMNTDKDEQLLTEGGDLPGTTLEDGLAAPSTGLGDGPFQAEPSSPSDPVKLLLPESSSDVEKGRKEDQKGRRGSAPGGGFSVRFREIGDGEARAKYERDERTIYINLDHPQIRHAMRTDGMEAPGFRRLCYEVAFTEYAIALAREMILAGEYYELDEPVIDVRDTLDRVTRAAAHLYAA